MRLEALHASEARQRRDGEQPQRQDHEARSERAAVGDGNSPDVRRLVVVRRLDAAIELHVPA
jgi:hypothetical protein